MSGFSYLFDLIKNRTHWDIQAIQEVMILMTQAQLGPLQEDDLFTQIRKKTEYSTRTLRLEYRQILMKHGLMPTDAGIEIAKKVLATEFQEGRYLIQVLGEGMFAYTGTHFIKVSRSAICKRIMPTVLAYKPYFGSRSATSIIDEVYRCLESLIDTHDPDDTPRNIINTATHEIWLNENGTYKLQAHDPNSRLFTCLPYEFDQTASCPLYQKTMLEIFSKCEQPNEVFRHWNEFLGYVIQPDRFITSVWFMIGSGENGKSTALKLLLKLLGPYSHSCDMRSFGNDFFKYRALFGKLLLVDEDFSQGLKINEALLKKISDNGQLTARSPHKMDTLTFINTAVPLLLGNHYPHCSDNSHGWSRRLNVFPFERQFAKHEVDPERFNKIIASEMPGILNLALAGYGRICQRGRKLDIPQDCLRAVAKFQENSNLLLMYTNARLKKMDGAHVPLKHLRPDIVQWASDQGVQKVSYGNNLKGELEAIGFIIGEMNGANSVKGYELNPSKG